MQVDLSGKVALITGATSGLGERFAQVLAQNGAKVVVTGRRVDRLADLKSRIEADGGEILALPLDVLDNTLIAKCVGDTIDAMGQIDILVNNSGIGDPGFATDFSEDKYDRIMGTNARGAFFMAQAVGRHMIEKEVEGRIINIASMAATNVISGLSVYCMSKAACLHMTHALALEWARYGINVNAICPGYIRTEINDAHWETEAGKRAIARMPRRRVGAPEDLDGILLLFASAREGRFITGASLDVADGQTLGI